MMAVVCVSQRETETQGHQPCKKLALKCTVLLSMVANTCNPSTGEAEGGGSHILGQPELHGENLSEKTKLKNR
jgi:hypothetical protein